jgi:hypothetical protein
LSAPVLTDDSVVVADFKGYVHWLDKNTGAFVGRAQAGGERISNAPVAVGDRVLVMNDEGKVTAFKTSPITLAKADRPARHSPEPQSSSPAAPAQEPGSSTSEAPSPAAPAEESATGESAAPDEPPSASESAAPAEATPAAPAEPESSPPRDNSRGG